ncbi:DUF896 domain-containing protein [Carnobacteriaceae bacterium 52-44]|jgi:uncharacterized protein YnzC (UPF0291/DUF896 family)
MLPEELVNRINALARKSKEEGLTEEEKEEQKELRKEYLKMIRGQVENHLTSIKVVDEEGNDVTPDKVKDLKNKKNK